MDYQRPDPDQGSTPYNPRVEDDFVRPLTPMRGVSRRRLPAALPFALAGILVVSSVAFGAAMLSNLTPPPAGSSSPQVIGDDNPTADASVATTDAPPAANPSEVAPVEATPGVLTLSVTTQPGKVILAWSAYEGDNFAYYKVVRSTDATASWPLGEGDTLVAAIDNISVLTYADATGAGTFTYRVFATKSEGDGYAVLASSAAKTVTVPPVPTPTPKPTQNCSISLSYAVTGGYAALGGGAQPATARSGANVRLTWSAYTCGDFEAYVVARSNSADIDFPLPHPGVNDYWEAARSTTNYQDNDVVPGHTYYYRVMAWTSQTFCEGGTVLAKTNIVAVTVPVIVPTPPPSHSAPPESEPPAPPASSGP